MPVSMDKATLIERISAIEKEESFSFFEDGKQVESRFNIGTGYERYNEGSRGTGLSKALYAVVANLAIFRAQGKEKASVGLQAFDVFFGKLIGEVKETSIVSSLSEERKKAIRIFSSFLDGTERVTMADILARAFPLLAVKFALTEEGIDKKTFQEFSKKKEILFNQTALFVRSLFHSFLTLENTDPFKIRTDLENLDTPYFVYDKTLMVATDKDDFTLKLLKEDIIANLENTAKNFSLKDIDSIAVIYLLREIFAVVSVAE